MLFTFLGLLLILIVGLSIIVPIYVNTNRHRDKLAEIVGKSLGGKASIAELDLSFRGGFNLVAKSFKLRDKGEKMVLLGAEEIYLSAKMLPLILHKRLEFKKVIIDSPYILINRDKEGGWTNFLTLPKEPQDENSTAPPEITALMLSHQFIIRGGTADIIDKKDGKSFNIRIRDIGFNASPEPNINRISVEIGFKVPDRRRLVETRFNGTINLNYEKLGDSSIEGSLNTDRISPAFLTPYLNKYPIYRHIDSTGKIKAKGYLNMKGVYHVTGSIDHILPASEEIRNISTGDTKKKALNITYDLGGTPNSININNISMTGSAGSIKIKGAIKEFNDNPDILLSGQTSPINIKWLKGYLYQDIFPKTFINVFKKHISGGKLSIESFSFEGPLSQLPHITERGNFKLLKVKAKAEAANIVSLVLYKDIENLSGAISLANGDISYKDLALIYNKCELYGISGSIDNIISYPKVDLAISAKATLKENTPCQLFNINNDNILTWLGGKIALKSTIKGNLNKRESIAAQGELNLSKASYSYGKLFRKEAGVNNIIKYNLTHTNKRLNIKSVSIHVNGSRLDLKGRIDLFRKGRYSLAINSNGIKVADFVHILGDMEKQGKGFLRVDGLIAGRNNNIKNSNIKGDILLYKVGFKIKNSLKEISNANANIEAINKEIFFPKASWFFGQDIVNASGKYKWIGNKRLDFNLQAKHLNIDYLLPKNKIDKRDKKEKTTIVGNIKTNHGSYKNLPFEDLRIGIYSADNHFIAKPFYCKGFKGGNMSGSWETRGGKGGGIEINIDAMGIDINNMAKSLSLGGLKEIRGRGDISVQLKGNGDTTQERKATMKGKASLILKDGSIHRLSVLSRIFSLLNLSKLIRFEAPDLKTDGMSYHYIIANFKVEDGQGTTEDFLLDSDSLRMSGVGEVNLNDNSIDMMIGVQPFQLIDKALSSIPIAGRVLTGDEGAFIVYYYSVTGRLKKPKVKSLPFETVSEFVINIIKRLITLPRDLVRGLRDPDKKLREDYKREKATNP